MISKTIRHSSTYTFQVSTLIACNIGYWFLKAVTPGPYQEVHILTIFILSILVLSCHCESPVIFQLFIKSGTCRPPDLLKFFLCRCLYVCVFVYVYLLPKLLITSAVIWTPYDWLSKFYSCYTAIVVGIINGYGLGIDTHHEN